MIPGGKAGFDRGPQTKADSSTIRSAPKSCGQIGIVTLLAIIILTALMPLILYPLAIAEDYPNHYVAFSIAFKVLQGGPPQSFYQVDWHLTPHLAMGILALPSALGMNIPTAFHLFLLTSAAMPVFGTWAVHRQIHGTTSWSLLLSLSFIYNICLYYGFLDFNFTLGLAFLLYALSLRQTSKATACGYILLSLGTAILFVSHLLGFLIFGLLLLSQRIQLCVRAVGARSKLELLFPPIIWLTPAAILVILWMKNPVGSLPHEAFSFGMPDPAKLLRAFWGPFFFGDPRPAIFLLPLFIVLIPCAIRIRLLHASREHLIPVGALLLATLVFSQRMGGVEIDFRLGMATFLLVVATVRLGKADSLLKQTIFTASALLLICGLSLQLFTSWQNMGATNHEVQAIRRALQAVPLRSRLIAASSADSRKFLHTGAFIALDRDGFFPQMFQVVQPIRARKEFAEINMPGAEIYGERLLAGVGKPLAEPSEGSWFNLNGEQGWPLRFDYLIWFSTSKEPMENLPFLELLNSGDHFFLYRINRKKVS
jgi:hypothetical protein